MKRDRGSAAEAYADWHDCLAAFRDDFAIYVRGYQVRNVTTAMRKFCRGTVACSWNIPHRRAMWEVISSTRESIDDYFNANDFFDSAMWRNVPMEQWDVEGMRAFLSDIAPHIGRNDYWHIISAILGHYEIHKWNPAFGSREFGENLYHVCQPIFQAEPGWNAMWVLPIELFSSAFMEAYDRDPHVHSIDYSKSFTPRNAYAFEKILDAEQKIKVARLMLTTRLESSEGSLIRAAIAFLEEEAGSSVFLLNIFANLFSLRHCIEVVGFWPIPRNDVWEKIIVRGDNLNTNGIEFCLRYKISIPPRFLRKYQYPRGAIDAEQDHIKCVLYQYGFTPRLAPLSQDAKWAYPWFWMPHTHAYCPFRTQHAVTRVLVILHRYGQGRLGKDLVLYLMQRIFTPKRKLWLLSS